MPEDIELVNVDPVGGLVYDRECSTAVVIPFIKGTAPTETTPCADAAANILPTDESPVVVPEVKPEVKPEVNQTPEKSWLQRLFN